MGNRAVITTNKNLQETGVYLHWNGGRDSVEGFLLYCKIKGFTSPDYDNYGFACLTGVIFNFFRDGLSLAVDNCQNLYCNNRDNGVYIIKDWKIVDRMYFEREEQRGYNLLEFIYELDLAQPQSLKITKDEWDKAVKDYPDIFAGHENPWIECIEYAKKRHGEAK